MKDYNFDTRGALLFFVLCFLYFGAGANSPKTKYNKVEYNKYKAYYNTAVQLSDTVNQIAGLVGMLSVKQDDTFALKILAYLYLATGSNSSGFVCADKYLLINRDNVELLKVQGTSLQASKDFQSALVIYTELFFRTREPQFKYLEAFMEYELFRQVEALKTIDECMQLPTAGGTLIKMTGDGVSEWVTIKAACMSLQALVYLDMKDYAKARTSFEEAIKLYPDFKFAKAKLESLSSNH